MTELDSDTDAVARQLAVIAIEAGQILRRMEHALLDPYVKQDGTPSTMADLAAEELIIKHLNRAWPGIPVIAEESANQTEAGRYFFLVDPLDGTGDFIHGTGEYSVNIALVRDQRPIAAVVAAPAMGRIWIAGTQAETGTVPDAPDAEIDWRPVETRQAPEQSLVALVSRRHGDNATEKCLESLSIGTRRTASSALKFCLIASGEADIYVRCGPTMEWDTAAGDHILSCAGGRVIGPGGTKLTYGHRDRNYRNGPFAALGDVTLAPRLALPVSC
ncbi:3'(2'),5'-bisphosphate nucleotidase CysQ [Microvirga rosea]|uniref:3'(2'),5'-bisphosphate nucleotidase CysQ n=1 Tax=Microvirga rosea TaxID=2715425 RepID=UPI001D0A9ABF|nr:3'(2'),5'-bisphosphate nucleotidase CysQ [Microvirga rosea]MCB8821653.1 3'(2'),5'-bisphosphate nucleotidase CysQ [Microvirga rosea]